MTLKPLVLDFYTKEDCELCDKARAALDRVLAKLDAIPIEVKPRNIEADPVVFEKYKWMIPVIELDDAQLAIYHVHERKLAKRLKRAWKARR